MVTILTRESTVCACYIIMCPLLNKKTLRELGTTEGWLLPSVVPVYWGSSIGPNQHVVHSFLSPHRRGISSERAGRPSPPPGRPG